MSTEHDEKMVVAIPVADGKLCLHFGHCNQFALLEVDQARRVVVQQTLKEPPPHEPGLLPRWLSEQGATMVIAGGMGRRARDIFADQGIDVVAGASVASPTELIEAYLDESLTLVDNPCDH